MSGAERFAWPATAAALGLAAAILLGPVASGAGGALTAQAPPDTVTIREPGLHPEGVEWDAARDRFLVGSVTRASVVAVRDDGSHHTLIEGPGEGGSIGIHVDAERDRLLVAYADLAVFQDTAAAGRAALGIYDLESGERIRLVDLAPLAPGGRHFANDVAVGPDGTAYVTDSFSPVIYAVPPEGEPSVLVRDPSLGTSGFGTNGIDHHPDGYLIVAMPGRGTFVRIPLGEPASLRDVELPGRVAADGIVLREDGSLVAVAFSEAGGGSEVVVLRSADGWRSAEITARADAGDATTAAVRGDAIYVVHPRFDAIGGEEPAAEFRIYRVRPGND